MSRYYTNWEDSSIEKLPSGWTLRWNAISTAFIPYYQARVKYATVPVKERAIEFYQEALSFPGGVSYDAVDADANRNNIEIVTLVKREVRSSPETSATIFFAFVRGNQVAAANANAYLSQLRFSDANGSPNVIAISKLVAGVLSTVASAAMTLDSTKSYWQRFRCQDSSASPSVVSLQLRVWADGDAEPSTWQIDTTDGSLLGQTGWTGFQWFADWGKGGGYVNFWSVATNGDSAFKPKTNTEFSTWLGDMTATRRVLWEAQTVGYDAAGTFSGKQMLLIPPGVGGSPTVYPATTPDSATISVTGDIDVRIGMRFGVGNVTAGAAAYVSKWQTTGQKSWFFGRSSNQLVFFWSSDGVNINGGGGCAMQFTEFFRDGLLYNQDIYLRVTADVSNADGVYEVRFYYSATGEDQTWTQAGDPIRGAAAVAIFDSTAQLAIGAEAGDSIVGIYSSMGQGSGSDQIFRVRVFNGIDGTLVSEFDPSHAAVGATSITSLTTGEVWTVHSPCASSIQTTFATARNVYIADGGFVSRAWDSPANQAYRPFIKSIPSINQEATVALSGKVETGFGKLQVYNPRQVAGGGGVRDSWLRMKWVQNYGRAYIGDPSWCKHDYRPYLVARIQQPTEPQAGVLEFELLDALDVLQRPLNKHRFTAGVTRAGELIPVLFGQGARIEGTQIDAASLEQQVTDGTYSLLWSGQKYAYVYDNGVPLFSSEMQASDLAETASTPRMVWRTASGSIFFESSDSPSRQLAHPFSEGSRIWFPAGGTPNGLTTGREYYVRNPATLNFQVSTTRGGTVAAISSDGSVLFGANQSPEFALYWENAQAGRLTPTQQTVGRVTVRGIYSGMAASNSMYPSKVIEQIVFTRYNLAQDYKDADTFAALLAAIQDECGMMLYDENLTCLDALQRFCSGTNTLYGMSPTARLQVARLALPTASPVMSLVESEIRGLKLDRVLLPIDRENFAVRYARSQYRNGPLQLSSAADAFMQRQYDTKLGDPWSSYGTPLDDHANISEMSPLAVFDSLFAESSNSASLSTPAENEKNRVQIFYAKKIGVFSFQARLRAWEVKLMQTISITHSREEWKLYSATDPPSPDDTASRDSRTCVVVGRSIDDIRKPFPVTLKVFRQLPGNYPIGNLT